MSYSLLCSNKGSFSRLLLPIVLSLLFLVALSPLSPVARADALQQHDGGVQITDVEMGFKGSYQDGNWVPVQVKLSNTGADFTGKVSISVPTPYNGTNNSSPSAIYQESISLPLTSQKQVTLFIPLNLGSQGNSQQITVSLLDNNGNTVTTRRATPISVNPNELYVGLVAGPNQHLNNQQVALPNLTARVHPDNLTPAELPTAVEAYNNFDMLVLDSISGSSFTHDQLAALQSWVQKGGNLVVIGGPQAHETLGALPASLLPVTLTGEDTLPAGTHLLPVGSPNPNGDDTLSSPVQISVATPRSSSSVLLSSGNTPLIVQGSVGQGLVHYLAYDPFLDPLMRWSGTSSLWSHLLFRTQGEHILALNSNNSNNAGMQYNGSSIENYMQTLTPNITPPIWLILVLLLSYILLLGPIRLILVRRLKKRDWSWRIVLATIVVFTLLSYGLALQQKGTSIISSNVSVIQLSRPEANSSLAHQTNYIGIFVPNQGDFQVRLPGSPLVQTVESRDSFNGQGGRSTNQPITVTRENDSTNVNLHGVDIWTLRTLVARQDASMHGGIVSHLTYNNASITGSITNTLPYDLSDAYILASNTPTSLGPIAAGETKQVTINNLGGSNSANAQSLADQIMNSHGISTNGYQPASVEQNTDEVHRHVNMLTALSGENCSSYGSCYSYANGGKFASSYFGLAGRGAHDIDGPSRTGAQDPLLLAGAPATFIAWANLPSNGSNDVTINGSTRPNTQEHLLQAPLDLTFANTVDIPASMFSSQIVDVQGNAGNTEPQTLSPGVYMLVSGSVTFELTLPNNAKTQSGSLNIVAGDAQLKNAQSVPGNQPTTDVSHAHTSIYNWHTNSWENKSFSANSFSLKLDDAQPYIGPGGRILVRVAHADTDTSAARETILFTDPQAEFNGTLAG